MALFISRFAQLPHSLKVVALVLNLLLIVSLLKSPSLPAGATIVWFTLGLAIIFDVAVAGLLLFELETHIFPIKIVTYTSVECGISLMLSVFYFMCMWLLVGSGVLTTGGWFTTAAILCLSLTGVYVCNFIAFLRQWMAEQRHARSQANNIYDYASYGSS